MKAIIPVAGIGSRLRPHTQSTPKSIMHVAGKPILAHIVDELVSLGISEFVLVVGHLRERVEAFARERYSQLRIEFALQKEPRGNGHAVYVARDHLDGSPTVIVFGDTILKGDLKNLIQSPRSVAGVKEVEDPRRLGVVELDGEGHITRLIEKPEDPTTNLALIGVYYIQNSRALRAALERLVAQNRQARGEFWLADGLQLMIDAGEKMGVFPIERWYDCGTVEALLQANRELLDLDPPDVLPHQNATVIHPSSIDPTAELEDSIVGPYASIAEGARIVNSRIRDSVVGPNAIVRNSALERSLVGENALVEGRTGRVNVAETGERELT